MEKHYIILPEDESLVEGSLALRQFIRTRYTDLETAKERAEFFSTNYLNCLVYCLTTGEPV